MPPVSKDPGRSLVGERIGRYAIRRQIARGGMGLVFEAVHEDIGHRAVVKVLAAELARDPKHQDYVERFLGEARAVNMVQHPGIVRIFDFGQLADSTVYILMEFLDGESLWERIERVEREGGKVGPQAALRIARQLASSLGAAHERGIVHRDLKPENVILVRDPEAAGEERTKLLDFGIAKFLDSPQRMTTAGVVMGTALYMSPEQCQGTEKLDDKADVYSLGVLLYELLAGALPFSGEAARVLRAHIYDPPPPLQAPCPGLPADLYTLVGEMMAKDPAARPMMVEVVERIAQIERSGALPASAPASALSAARAPAATRRTQLVTARREQGGLYLSWPLLVVGVLGTVLLTLLATIFALGGLPGTEPPATPRPRTRPLPGPAPAAAPAPAPAPAAPAVAPAAPGGPADAPRAPAGKAKHRRRGAP